MHCNLFFSVGSTGGSSFLRLYETRSRTKERHTPLDRALERNQTEVVEILRDPAKWRVKK